MKISKVFPDLIVIKKWHVRSSSGPGLHLVEKMIDRSLRCDCIGFMMRHRDTGFECKHIKRVIEIIKKEEDKRQEALL